MAKKVITASDIVIFGTDYSSVCKNVAIEATVDEHVVTDYESAGWEEKIAGIKRFSLTFDVDHDEDLGGLDEDIWDNFGSVVAFTVSPDGGLAISQANPDLVGNVLVNAWRWGAPVGSPNSQSFTFPGTGALTRDETP